MILEVEQRGNGLIRLTAKTLRADEHCMLLELAESPEENNQGQRLGLIVKTFPRFAGPTETSKPFRTPKDFICTLDIVSIIH